jgi:hypothetical protein
VTNIDVRVEHDSHIHESNNKMRMLILSVGSFFLHFFVKIHFGAESLSRSRNFRLTSIKYHVGMRCIIGDEEDITMSLRVVLE